MTLLRIIALSLIPFALFPLAATADTLIDHVDGITPDGKGGIEHFTGVITGNDGRIILVLHAGEPHPRTDFAVDAKGAVMLPGLIDSHVHLMDLGFAALTLDLSGTRSLAEAQARITAYAAIHPDRPWILGTGWDQDRWGLKDADGHARFPTTAELDAAVADRPVWLINSDGHAGWANTQAMALAGITTASKPPEGGRIERLAPGPAAIRPRTTIRGTGKGAVKSTDKAPAEAIGAPSGIFVDAAMALISKAVPPPRPEDRDLALGTAQDILIRHGVTTVHDMATSIEDWQAFRRAGDDGRLYIRIIAYADGLENMVLIGGPGPTPWLYNDHLRLAGVSFAIDGALGSRGAYLKAPYSDAPGNTGIQHLTDTQLKNLMSRAAMDHFQVAVHATGDAATAEAFDAITELTDTYTGKRHWRVEQTGVVDPADMPRLAQLTGKAGGIALSMSPLRQMEGRAMAEARLGPDRLPGVYAWKSLMDTGAVLAFSSAGVPAPFAGMAAAISRHGPDDAPQGGWPTQEHITPEAALTAYTAGAAWAGFAEDRIGRIAQGLRADFILTDRNPLHTSPDDLAKTKILQVWINGQQVWKATEVPEILPHEDAVISHHQAQ